MKFRKIHRSSTYLIGFKIIQKITVILLLAGTLPFLTCDKNQTKNSQTQQQLSRDSRMKWWREARFGMFIHWGLYSVPAGFWNGERYGGNAEWIMNKAQIPIKDYEKLAKQFNPTKYDPDEWVQLAKEAGMKYLIITSKHHDGFCLWDSKETEYDVIDATPYQDDLLKKLADACKRHGMTLGFYHSILDWHHPDYLPRRPWDTRSIENADFNRYIDYMKVQLTELLNNYPEIAVIWFDGGWEHGAEEYRAQEIVDYLHSIKPDLIINDRFALPMDFATPEQRIPKDQIPNRDWETCMTMNGTWGFHKDDHNWKTSKDLIRKLIDIASKGGNFLLNVGPTAEGIIPKESVHTLKEIGRWMKINGASIYGTKTSPFLATPWGRSTIKSQYQFKNILYLHVFDWPTDGFLKVPGLGSRPIKIYVLNQPEDSLFYHREKGQVVVDMSSVSPDKIATVIVMEFRHEVVTYHPPSFRVPSNIFINTLEVELTTPSTQLDIHFTLDGSNPTEKSERYFEPIKLARNVTVKARSFYNGNPVSDIVEDTFQKVVPNPAIKIDEVGTGIFYEYYEGNWDQIPDFDELSPVETGICEEINLEKRNKQENFGFRFSGYFDVEEDEVYKSALISDDGSNLFIDDELVIDNDGLHSSLEKFGEIALAKGMHKIKVNYFNKLGGKKLELKMGEIRKELELIPLANLFH